MTYDVDYFIKKFEAIPEKNIISRSQGENGSHCAIGHCINIHGMYGNAGTDKKYHYSYSKEAHSLSMIFLDAGIYSTTFDRDNVGWNVADVNNGDNPKYQQPTPKQRILAALYDIKKLNQGTEPSTERRNEVQSGLYVDQTKNFTQLIPVVEETTDKILEDGLDCVATEQL